MTCLRRSGLVAGLLLIACPAAAQRPDLWLHRGSVMVATWAGNAVSIRYELPSDEVRAVGVGAGTILFEGRTERRFGRIHGEARVFPRPCRRGVTYRVSGRVTRGAAGLHEIRLRGPAPTVIAGCRAAAWGRGPNARLVFLEWTE